MAGNNRFAKWQGKTYPSIRLLVIACGGVLSISWFGQQPIAEPGDRPLSLNPPKEPSTVGIPAAQPLTPGQSFDFEEVGHQLITLLAAKEQRLTFAVPETLQGQIVYEGNVKAAEKVIALTIDDGPAPQTTEQMLDIFKQTRVKATFFWVGEAVKQFPEIAKRVVAEGHAIGNHTFTHSYSFHNRATLANEVDGTAELIYQTTGVKTSLFRPPGGFLNNGVAKYAQQKNYAVVMWSLTSADTDPRAKPDAFVRNVVQGAKPGAIVLMHDGGGDRARTVQALPPIIAGLKQQGYRFVTVPELLEMQEQQREDRS